MIRTMSKKTMPVWADVAVRRVVQVWVDQFPFVQAIAVP